jgi:drug/metabolite transporter (DMT)-like permease
MRKSTAPRLLKLQLGGLLMVFFSASVLLMASLKDKATGRYPFHPSSVVISVEALKFVVTFCVVAKQGQLGLLRGVFTLSSFRYALPALLYMTNNTLDFAVLLYIQAPLASLLNNAKIVLTGIVFRFALGRRLNMIQWISIALLTLGMAIAKEEPGGAHSSIGPGPGGGHVAARASTSGMGGSMGGSGSGLGGGGRGGEGVRGGSGDGGAFIGSLSGHMFGVGLKVRGSGRVAARGRGGKWRWLWR